MKIPQFTATAIGSFPYDSASEAVSLILENITDAPVWPQLPKTSLNEQMEIQYSEGLPCVVIDKEKERMYFETSGDYSESFGEFYENYMLAMDPDEGTGDCSALAISEDFSKGIYELENQLKNSGSKKPFVKVQVTGPCSFALTIVDENKRAIYYNEEFRDVIVKALAMKSRWQIQKFKPYAENIICFIDEPILSAFGSSTYISVKREDVIAQLSEVIEAIHMDGAIAGIHCCGNTEWSILIEAGVDMVNFDAFGYGETIALYPTEVKSFIEKGGYLAWGLIPTSEDIREQTAEKLIEHFNAMVSNLSEKTGLDAATIHAQSVITPSCGTGSMPQADAEKVFSTLKEVSAKLQAK